MRGSPQLFRMGNRLVGLATAVLVASILLGGLLFVLTQPVYAAAIDLELSYKVNQYQSNVGDTVTFTLRLTNTSGSIANNIIVSNTVPAGFTILATAGDGTFDNSAGTWTLASVGANSTAVLTLTTQAIQGGLYVIPAQVAAMDAADTDPDSTPGNSNPREDDQMMATLLIGNSNGFCYLAGDGVARTFYGYDTINDIITPVGPINGMNGGNVSSLESNAFNPFNGIMYASHEGGNNTFGTIDLTTGEFFTINNNLGVDFDGMEYDLTTGLIWATNIADEIYTIDPATGLTTFVTSTAGINIDAMAIDPATGLMYVVDSNTIPDDIVVIDKELGTIINRFTITIVPPRTTADFDDLEGLSFGLDGLLRGTSGGQNGAPPAYIVYDKDTGQPTQFVDFSSRFAVNPDFESISCDVVGNDLLVLKDDGRATFAAGDTLTYTINITNSAMLTGFSLIVTDTIPTNTTFVNATAPFTQSGRTITFTLGDLPTGANRILTVALSVSNPYSGPALLTNRAVVFDDGRFGPDPNPANNRNDDTNSLATITSTLPVTGVGSLGNQLWLDENGNGRLDAGEQGIPNIVIELRNITGTLVATATTDLDGRYLFPNLNAGDYTVTVIPTPGLTQTQIPAGGGDFTNHANGSTFTVGNSKANLTADFGYNYAPSGDTDNPPPGALGAIGDRVWIDANNDGLQNPGEPGLGGITLTLTASDGTTQTDVTTPDGSYIFDDLPAGVYIITVNNPPPSYTNSFDPDGNADSATDPIILAPGDVFLNADFGYAPDTAPNFSLGDTIWLDADGSGTQEAGELGIPNVTLALAADANTNGQIDPGEIIATTQTNASGLYTFTGLSNGNYLVLVNDTFAVLTTLSQTVDFDGLATPNLSTATIASANDPDQDFGYRPIDAAAPGSAIIGDTVWFDANGNQTQDPVESGIQGIVVNLQTPTKTFTTSTDANGRYYFPGLVSGTYTVTIKVPAGFTVTADPNLGTNTSVTLTLPTTTSVNLAQDFGLGAVNPGSISGTIWDDTNADGIDNDGGTPISGVTVELYSDIDGDGLPDLLATATTDASGNYTFTALPSDNVTYSVHVADAANILNGRWHSDGPPPNGVDNHSQPDVYMVTLTAANPNDPNGDFGYYANPATVGNLVFNDTNFNGLFDGGESGIGGITVTLTITYPNGDVVTAATTTNPSGLYTFTNLLLDEDYNGQGAGQPTHTISAATPPGLTATYNGTPTSGVDNNSDNPAGTQAAPVQGTADNANDFGFGLIGTGPGNLGNQVWLDENGDGRLDAGERGLPNLVVELRNITGTLVATTTTDLSGRYLFPNLDAGAYAVTIITTTGLVQTQIPAGGGDFTNHPNGSTFAIIPGATNPTADFGFNYAPSNDTDNPTPASLGAIGDRLWVDTNSNGLQDPGERGLGGVTLTLTASDGTTQTVVTTPDGSYIFDNLPAGVYSLTVINPPAGYDLSFDPDGNLDGQFGAIVLSPGDVFLNADFGYSPDGILTYTLGDTVWLDVDGSGVQDGIEQGIPNVTLALAADANTNGQVDPGEIIATTHTAADGSYAFTGLEDGAYLVLVNDTYGVLVGLTPTADGDGTGTPNLSAITIAGADDLDQDFGYQPQVPAAAPSTALIGDTIWFDANGDRTQDANESGLQGIQVVLQTPTATLTTTTNANGNYYFPGLISGTYTVTIKVPAGFTVTADPSLGTNTTSTVTLPTSTTINLSQDFGLGAINPGSISGTIWADTNADGIDNDGGTGISNVTVELYTDLNGDGIPERIATTTTDANGNYTFAGLPSDDVTYSVHVADDGNVLDGRWRSNGPPANGVDNHSQADVYVVTLTAANPTDPNGDFGYYNAPASVGNLVFTDLNQNGIYDPITDTLASGITVTLTISYPNGATTVITTYTDSNGEYSFGNLLLDEDFDGQGTGEPTFLISIQVPTNLTTSYNGTPTSGVDNNSDNPAGTTAAPIQGSSDNANDFGIYDPNPTAVTLSSASATAPATLPLLLWLSTLLGLTAAAATQRRRAR